MKRHRCPRHHSCSSSTGTVELLADLESGLSTRQRQLLDIARRHSARLRDEIRDLLDARELLDLDPADVELERHDLVSLIRTHLAKRDQALGALTVTGRAPPIATLDATSFLLALRLVAATTQQYGANTAGPPDIIIDIHDDAIRLLVQVSSRTSSVDAEQDTLRLRLAEVLLMRSNAALAVTATDQSWLCKIRIPTDNCLNLIQKNWHAP